MMRARIFLILLVFFGAKGAETTAGQIRFGRSRVDSEPLQVFLNAPRPVQQQLSKAQKALDAERYPEAVELLGNLLLGNFGDLDDYVSGQDYFIFNNGRRVSVKSEAQRMLGKIPARGREWYELKFGTDARLMLNEAIASMDERGLAEVSRKYFHTQAGYEAAMLAGRLHLDQGRPLAAALYFKQLADSPPARTRLDPQLSILLAASWMHANRPDECLAVLNDLKLRNNSRPLSLGGQKVGWFRADGDAQAWLRATLGNPAARMGGREVEWVVHRGNLQRNGLVPGGFPLLSERWRVHTVNDPLDMEMVAERRSHFDSHGITAIPSIQPLAIGRTVIMRTAHRVVAVDIESGKRVWDYPWFESEEEEGLDEIDDQRDRSRRTNELGERLWEDAVYGQMSSDRRRLYMLDELTYTSSFTIPSIRVGGFPPRNRRATNQLVALSVEDEGTLLWVVGGESGEDEPQLAGASFLGPPLPLMDQLYVLAELNGELRLVVLDPLTGQLQWSQQLAQVADLPLWRDPQRRLAGATPSFADGVLICPTSAGACVAVDIGMRNLLWGYTYTSNRPTTKRHNYHRPPRLEVGQRWVDGTATIVEGSVLLTPIESNKMHCLDLLTGNSRWTPIDRGDMLYVAGVHEGTILLVGTESLRGIRLSDGKPAWEADLDLGGAHPSGRGFLTGPYYYLPTNTAELLKVSVKDGKVIETTKTDVPLGNLLSYRDQIVSQNVDWLSTYFQSEPLRNLVTSRLKEDPKDPWALTRFAEIQLQDGLQDEAMKTLRIAHALQPGDDVTKTLLVDTLMDALDRDFEQYQDVAGDLDGMIEQRHVRLRYLRLLADGFTRTGKSARALDNLDKIMEMVTEPGNQVSLDAMIKQSPTYDLRMSRWISARYQSLYEVADDELRQRLDETAARWLHQAGSDPMQWSQFVQLFGFHPLADAVKLQLAEELIQRDTELLQAELLLSDLLSHRQPEIAAAANAKQVQLLLRANRHADAIPFIQKLKTRFCDVICYDNVTGRQYADGLLTDNQWTLQPSAVEWPIGKVTVLRRGLVSQMHGATRKFNLVHRGGAASDGTTVHHLSGTRALMIRDEYGQTIRNVLIGSRFFTPADEATQQARLLGHLLLVNVGFDLVMVDALHADSNDPRSLEAIRWRKAIVNFTPSSQTQFAKLQSDVVLGEWGGRRVRFRNHATRERLGSIGPFLSDGVVFQRIRDIQMVEPLSGEIIWKRSGFTAGCEIFGDRDYLYVIEPDSNEAVVLRTRDGELMGRRPVPRDNQRWFDIDGKLITARKVDGQLHFALLDVFSGEELWTVSVDQNSIATRVDTDEIAIVQPDGQFMVRDAFTGKRMIQAQVEADEEIKELFVFRSSRDYLVVVNHEEAVDARYRHWNTYGSAAPMINGEIYSFERSSGRALWPVPARVVNYGMPLDQPKESPILLFLRQTSDSRSRGTPNPTKWLLCLSRQTGEAVVDQMQLDQHPSSNLIQVDPELLKTDILLPRTRLSLEFSDEPRPPAPPFRMKPPESSALKRLINAIRREPDDDDE